MKLTDLFTQEALDQALTDKMVKREKHPELDLWVYNYTANTQFAWVWNDVTLNCRGLIADGEGNIVARPFKKFFSYEQLDGKLPEGDFVVEEKMDGSMLVAVMYQGQLVTATRGSFVSDQAKRGKELLGDFLPLEGYTFIFEVIYPENRVVVNYDFSDVVLLSVWQHGQEFTAVYYKKLAKMYGFRTPKVYSFDSLEEILSYEEPNLEGFVLRYSNGERVKIKLEEYKRLHRLITGVSEKTVWEAMRNGTLEELLEGTPDEFYDFVEEVRTELQEKYNEIELTAKIFFIDLGDRKTNALHYQNYKYPSILFHMLDGKDYSDNIWKLIRPEVTRVFKMVSEDAN
jgi:RNA ligase